MDEQKAASGTPPAFTPSSPSLPSSPHWSESFVEHLRTVHFALSILAVAIIFTLLSGKEYDALKATTQASEILSLSENWDRNMSRLFDALPAMQGKGLPAHDGLYVIKDKKRHDFLLASKLPEPSSNYEVHYFIVSKENLRSVRQWQDFAGPDKRPTTVASFRLWWNTLHRGVSIPVADIGGPDSSEGCRTILLEGPGVPPRARPKATDPTNCSVEMELGIPHDDSGLDSIDCYDFDGEKGTADCNVFAHRLDLHKTEFAFGIVGFDSYIDETIMKLLYGDWGIGVFKTAFPDLAKATSPDLEYVDLKSLVDRLSEGSKGDQVIEAFGLKIAATDVTRWGLLVLLAAQFYFWLHLYELTRRIEPSDPGWKVAWIGIYQPWLAFVTVVVSACILPLVAASLAAYRLRLDGHPYWQRSITALATGVSACLALSIGSKLYKLRSGVSAVPKVFVAVEPTEPAV
jgi:hypothetical protein